MRPILPLLLLLACSGCAIQHPVREVAIPSGCEALVQRATTRGVGSLSEPEKEELAFCQERLALRTAEEQAAAARDQGRAARLSYTATLVASLASFVLSVVALTQ